jgi:hypothetical protein
LDHLELAEDLASNIIYNISTNIFRFLAIYFLRYKKLSFSQQQH